MARIPKIVVAETELGLNLNLEVVYETDTKTFTDLVGNIITPLALSQTADDIRFIDLKNDIVNTVNNNVTNITNQGSPTVILSSGTYIASFGETIIVKNSTVKLVLPVPNSTNLNKSIEIIIGSVSGTVSTNYLNLQSKTRYILAVNINNGIYKYEAYGISVTNLLGI